VIFVLFQSNDRVFISIAQLAIASKGVLALPALCCSRDELSAVISTFVEPTSGSI
jgi:hypothetical protein